METDQPTGEWTARKAATGYIAGLYSGNTEIYRQSLGALEDLERIADAHNASISAEREYNSKCHARMSERKSVHQWLTAQNIPEEENGKRICLLRRLRITLDRLAETENEVDGLKDANRGLFIESNERFHQVAALQASIKEHNESEHAHSGAIEIINLEGFEQLAAEREKVALSNQMVAIESKRANEAEKQLAAVQADIVRVVAKAKENWSIGRDRIPAKYIIDALSITDTAALDAATLEAYNSGCDSACIAKGDVNHAAIDAAQQPLVDALKESNGVLKVIYNYGLAENSKETIGEVIDRNTDALAKVKEGK